VHLNRWFLFIAFILISLSATGISQAAGIIMRVQQMKNHGQQPQQQLGQVAQGQAQNPQPSYQQTVDARNQAIAQAILDAHNKSVSTESSGDNDPSANPVTPSLTAADIIQQPAMAVHSGAQDTVDLSEVWKKLDNKSTVWKLLMDDQAKVLTVAEYIDRYHQEGVKINEPPLHYAQMIDEMSKENPDMLNMPFGQLLQVLAIVDYDFDNGMDKDTLAKKVLGEAGFEANKKRFTQQSTPNPSP